MENYRLIAAVHNAAIENVSAKPDSKAGNQDVNAGLEIISNVIPIANANPPKSVDTSIPVSFPLIVDHASDEPTSADVVINVPTNAIAPIPVKIVEPHENALLMFEDPVGIAAAVPDVAAVPGVPAADIL